MPYTTNYLKPYNFEAALKFTPEERFTICLERVEKRHRERGYDFWPVAIPPIGGTDKQIADLESRYGPQLPAEYVQLLRRWCYLDIDTGLNIWGFSYDDVSIGFPGPIDLGSPPHEYFQFGDYWNYADGDALLFDLSEPTFPVVVFMHEHGPLIEYFAPSFSLALWRMVHEWLE